MHYSGPISCHRKFYVIRQMLEIYSNRKSKLAVSFLDRISCAIVILFGTLFENILRLTFWVHTYFTQTFEQKLCYEVQDGQV